MKSRSPARSIAAFCLKGLAPAVAALVSVSSAADAPGDLLAVLRFTNASGDPRFTDFHLMLRKRFEYEMLVPGIPAKAWDASFDDISRIDSVDTSRFRFIIFGGFAYDSVRHEPSLSFTILNRREGTRTEKHLSIGGMSAAEVADIVVLKVSDFLRRSLLGTLSVASHPAGCEILLDGVATGVTPKEFALQAGTINVEVRGEFLRPYRQRVEITPGAPISVTAQLQFRGFPTLSWLAAALGATGITAAAWAVEENYHHRYRDLPETATGDEFADRYNAYRNANTVRLVLQHATIVPWTGAAFCFFINRSIEKRVLARR